MQAFLKIVACHCAIFNSPLQQAFEGVGGMHAGSLPPCAVLCIVRQNGCDWVQPPD